MKTLKYKHTITSGGYLTAQHPMAKPGYDGRAVTIAVNNVPDNVHHADILPVLQTMYLDGYEVDYTDLRRGAIIRSAQALGRLGGAAKTPAKIAASRENGKMGGRPVEWVHGQIEVGRELSYLLPGGARVNLGKIIEIRPNAEYPKTRRVAVCERGERGYGRGLAKVYTRSAK